MNKERKPPEWLHLYPGAHNHDAGAVVGSRAGLTELRDAINEALSKGSAVSQAFVNDGEGYCVFVHVLDEDEMSKMALPYTEEWAMDIENADVTWPHQLEERAMDAYREKFLRPNA